MIARGRPAWLLTAVVFLWGCQPTVYLMPAPVGLSAEQRLNVTPEEEKDGSIVIGYATNRLPDKRDKSPFYSKKFDDTLRFGVATVQIGKEAKSWDELHRLSAQRDRKEKLKMVLTGVDHRAALAEDEDLEALNPELEAMFATLNWRIDNSPLHDITVYVHGANCNFYRVASQAAQYRHFTGRTSAVIFYSWPSAENLIRYGRDVENIEATVPTFVRFIKMLALHSNAQRINILAYSAGAQLATKSLAALGAMADADERGEFRRGLRLGNVYYAAPDADFDAFVEQLSGYADLADNVTVTANEKDSVLKLSQRFGNKKSRTGKPDIEEADAEYLARAQALSKQDVFDIIYIDTEVIPDIATGSHDYWYNNPWVSTDALFTLNFDRPPRDRGMVSLGDQYPAELWSFPPDYDTRVIGLLKDQLEQAFGEPGENLEAR